MVEPITGVLGIELTSALIGGLGGVTTYGFLNWNQRRISRDRFRRSLLFEIQHIGDTLEHIEQTLGDTDDPSTVGDADELQAFVATDLLDAEFQSIGKLTTREIEQVYQFYEATNVVRQKIGGEIGVEERDTIQRHVNTALEKRDAALASINRSRLSQLTERYKDVEASR